MSLGLDELLRSRLTGLLDESRAPIEDVAQDVLRRVRHRRRLRRAGAVCGVLALLTVALAGPTVLGGDATPDVKTGAPTTTSPPLAPARPVSIERIDAYGGLTGTARIVVHFNSPVPADAPTYVDDIEHPGAAGIVYTTQRPSEVKVCGNRHFFPGDKGTVDVLIPTAWLRPGIKGSDIPLEMHDDPGKVPVCGGPNDTWPMDSYIQIAVWGPASDDPAHVSATVSPDGTELIVEIRA
jgi:hypothetical protein